MIRLSLPLMLVLFTSCTNANDETVIREAEARLVLPAKADPLSSYDRFYAVTGRGVRGIFIWSPSGKGKMRMVVTEKELPFVADGGCGVIQVRLDLKTKLWERPYCQGP